jgi:RNA polymerase sigma-70 factor (ECF subfamily)
MTNSTRSAVAESVTTREADTDERNCQGFNDARLVEMTRDGSHEAFAELVRRYESRLIRVISRFILDPVMVEDLTQEVFLRAYRKLELFDASRRFGPWLFQIGVNMTLDHLRKTQRRIKWTLFSQKRSEDQRTIDPETADPRSALDLSQEVRSVLDQIPEKYRTVLVLRDLENFSTSEIAAITDRKEATIRWRLAEARAKFQKLWTARIQRDSIADRTEVDNE